MTKVAEIIRFYSLDEIMDFVEKGGEYPMHHVWCYDKIMDSGMDAGIVEYNRDSFLNKLGKKLTYYNLQQQINLYRRSKEFDVVYSPFLEDVSFLALLRSFGLFKKPIVALALDSHVPFKKHPLKRLTQKMFRKAIRGVDYVLFFNEPIYHQSNEYGPLGKNRGFTNTWGADLDFFRKFTDRQTAPPTGDFIFATGGTGRDFKTLIQAFDGLDMKLKIATKRDEGLNNAPSNVMVDNSVKPGLHSVGILRNDYYNSLAVAIPLLDTGRKWPVGITVIMEALAMAKPILSTYNPSYPFDLEKEKIGYYVDYGDVEGWRQVIQHFTQNPDEAREMGERGRYLCEKKFNYKLFSEDVIKHLNKFNRNEKTAKIRKLKVSAAS